MSPWFLAFPRCICIIGWNRVCYWSMFNTDPRRQRMAVPYFDGIASATLRLCLYTYFSLESVWAKQGKLLPCIASDAGNTAGWISELAALAALFPPYPAPTSTTSQKESWTRKATSGGSARTGHTDSGTRSATWPRNAQGNALAHRSQPQYTERTLPPPDSRWPAGNAR